jgi:hypothetical protein
MAHPADEWRMLRKREERHMIRAVQATARGVFIAAAVAAIAGCGHIPWSEPPAPQVEPAHELQELAEDGTPTQAFPQFWKRNTLVVDLQDAAPAGKFILKPREGSAWPVRIAFRARPGTLGVIEVHANQRMLIPVTTSGSATVDLELAPGVYTSKSEQMTVQWGK